MVQKQAFPFREREGHWRRITAQSFRGARTWTHGPTLCSAFQIAIAKGWKPVDKKKEAAEKKKRLSSIADVVLERKLKFDYSHYYRRDLIRTHEQWNKYLKKQGLSNSLITDLTIDVIAEFVYEYAPSPASMKNLKRNISSLLRDELETHGVFLNYKRIKLPRTTQRYIGL